MATGTSNGGYQTIVSVSSVSSGLFSLYDTQNLNTAPFRLGYAYVFTKPSGSSQPYYLVDRLPIYRPGILKIYGTGLFPSGNTALVTAQWNYSGVQWSASFT